jgi:hypothetical protein
MDGEEVPRPEAVMQRDPFLDFHQTAERAGFPAMLIVSMVALGLVVAPVLVLALTRAVWMLVIAVLSIFAALALLAGEVGASFADGDETPARRARSAAASKREAAGRLPRREPGARSNGHERRAA